MAARHLQALRVRGRRFGKSVLRVVEVCVLLSALGSAVAYAWVREGRLQSWQWQRSRMVKELSASSERHLVVVTYGAHHSPHHEWVYNGADIDGSPVVWARSMGRDRDKQLLEYFSQRRAWRLHVGNDAGPFRLEPIDPQALRRDTMPGRLDSLSVSGKDELSCSP
jgi:hypothetical protein